MRWCGKITDYLVAGLLIWFVLRCVTGNCIDGGRTVLVALGMSAVYFLCRIVNGFCPKIVQFAVLGIIAATSLYESFFGLMQLFGHFRSNHFMYACTGTFQNPGPYGGFLAVCASVLGAYAIFGKNVVFKYICSIVSLTALVIIPSTMSRAAVLGVACAALVMAVSCTAGKSFIKKHKYWLIALALLVGGGAYAVKKPSADGRFFITKISSQIMVRHALFGVGQGHFGGAYGQRQYEYFGRAIDLHGSDPFDWTVLNKAERMTADCPEYPFNEFVLIGVENGIPAMLLFMSIFVMCICCSFKEESLWAYGLVSFAVFAFFSYPLHIPLFQIQLALLLAMSVPLDRNSKSDLCFAAIAFLICLVSFFCRYPKYRQSLVYEKQWQETELWYNMEYYDYVVEDAAELYEQLKFNSRFMFEYGQSLSKTGQYAKSDSVLMTGAAECCDPMFWNIMGNNSLAQGNFEHAQECYMHAFRMVPNRLYPLCRMANLYYVKQDFANFEIMRDIIDKFPAKIESATTERLRSEVAGIADSIRIKYGYGQ